MGPLDIEVGELRQQIESTQERLRELKIRLHEAEQVRKSTIAHPTTKKMSQDRSEISNDAASDRGLDQIRRTTQDQDWPLNPEEYKRYGRQLIMPEIGLQGQLALKSAKVLIVGMGGLGCPAAAYLAGAGVGTLGLVDGDTVEESNLHRQVLHSTDRVGMSKVASAHEYLKSLNPLPTYALHPSPLTPTNALPLFRTYDLILDCTDHPTTRYLISDAAVLARKPLVSASALKTEGQLVVLNNPALSPGSPAGGPCYRCVFPVPPPAAAVQSCGEGGVLGPVVGVMGVLQALEAIKVLTQVTRGVNLRAEEERELPRPSLLMFSAYGGTQFRSVRLRARRKGCLACSAEATVTEEKLESGGMDYVAFCGETVGADVLEEWTRVSAADFARRPEGVVIDVRDATQFGICSLPGSVNVPWTGNAEGWYAKARESRALDDEEGLKYVVCRVGNDSQLAAKAMLDRAALPTQVKDVQGGFAAWRKQVDPNWPDY